MGQCGAKTASASYETSEQVRDAKYMFLNMCAHKALIGWIDKNTCKNTKFVWDTIAQTDDMHRLYDNRTRQEQITTTNHRHQTSLLILKC